MTSLMPDLTAADAVRVAAAQSDRPPRVGDVWVTSWDGVDLGLVVLAAVREGYSLVWPVADSKQPASFPCFHLPLAGWGFDLIVWPEAEAGMSNAVLSRRLGPALSDRQTRAIHAGIRDQDDDSLPENLRYAEVRDDPATDDALADVCAFAGGLCEIEWTDPRLGVSPFDTGTLVQLGVTPQAIADIASADIPPAMIGAMFSGQRIAPQDLTESLAAGLGVAPEALLARISGPQVSAINDPSRKADVVTLADWRHINEAESRVLVWETSQRAARSSGGSEDANVDQALADLLRDSEH